MMTAEVGEREREMTYFSAQYMLSCHVMLCHTFIKQKRQQDRAKEYSGIDEIKLGGTGDGYKAFFEKGQE
jgi:hypothetical protein